MSDATENTMMTASEASEATLSATQIARNEAIDAGEVYELDFPIGNGKKNAVYDPEKEFFLNLAIPRQRDAAEELLIFLSDYSEAKGVALAFALIPDVTALPTNGRITFSPQYKGKGEARELAAVSVIRAPSYEEITTQGGELAKNFFEEEFAALVTKIARNCLSIDVTDEGVVASLNTMPTDVFNMLAPKPRAMSADPYIHVLVAFAEVFIGQAMKGHKAIPRADLQRCLKSSHFATTSAYREYEAPTEATPTGVFATVIDKANALFTRAVSDEAVMTSILTGLSPRMAGKKKEEFTADVIRAMQAANYFANLKADRITAMLKMREVKRSDAEQAAEQLLSII